MRNKGILRNQKGGAAVEFAIVLLPLLLVIFGSIEFGFAMFNRQVITNAAREGARFGIVMKAERRTNTEIKEEVREKWLNHLITFGPVTEPIIDIPIVGNDPDAIANGTQRCISWKCDLEVTVTYDYEFLFLKNFGIGPWEIRSTAKMRME